MNSPVSHPTSMRLVEKLKSYLVVCVSHSSRCCLSCNQRRVEVSLSCYILLPQDVIMGPGLKVIRNRKSVSL